jgi:hypothetical protein
VLQKIYEYHESAGETKFSVSSSDHLMCTSFPHGVVFNSELEELMSEFIASIGGMLRGGEGGRRSREEGRGGEKGR